MFTAGLTYVNDVGQLTGVYCLSSLRISYRKKVTYICVKRLLLIYGFTHVLNSPALDGDDVLIEVIKDADP